MKIFIKIFLQNMEYIIIIVVVLKFHDKLETMLVIKLENGK